MRLLQAFLWVFTVEVSMKEKTGLFVLAMIALSMTEVRSESRFR